MERKEKKELKRKLKEDTADFVSGFKKFITRGNVVDLAVAVIIGGAFNKIVSSLVNDIIMPVVSIWLNKTSFTELVWEVRGSQIKYGNFIQMVVEFLIIAFSIYVSIEWFLKSSRRKKAKELALEKERAALEEKPVTPKPVITPTEALLTEIRDLLKDGQDKELITK